MWFDYFIKSLHGFRVIVSADGCPRVAIEIAKGEFVEIELTQSSSELPFRVTFRDVNESRVYGYAGTRGLALKLAIEVAELRLNSHGLVSSAY